MIFKYPDFEAEVTRKRIKNLNLRIRDGRVLISIPTFVSKQDTDKFVYNNYSRIIAALEKQKESGKAPQDFENGGKIKIFDSEYELVLVSGRQRCVEKNGDKLLVCIKPGDDAEKKEKLISEYLKKMLTVAVARKLEIYQPMMGLYCSDFHVTDMKSRWGSCNTRTKRLNFNLKLIHMPEFCLEYVVIHELAHIAVSNHSEAFWIIVQKYCPEYKKIRKYMRE